MRPKSLDHLLAVQPIAGREGKQLDQASGPSMPPRGCGQRAAVDLHLEPTEQLDLYARHLLPVCTRGPRLCGRSRRVFRLPDGDLLGIALVDAQIPHEATVLPGPWKEARRDDASFDRGEVVHEHSEPAELLRS